MEWQARWIWAGSHSSTPNFYLYARREFDIPALATARIFVTCSSEYKLCVNGRHIGRGPGPCDPALQYYDEYDITHAVRPGRNVIAALCYNYGVETSFRPQSPGGFLLQAEFTNSHDALVIGTDESWKVKPAGDWDFGSPRMSPTTGFQEVYDSRGKPVGWNVVGFDDSSWENAQVLGEVGMEPWTRLIPREIPHLKEHEVFAERAAGCENVKYPKSALDASGETALVAPEQEAFLSLDFGREVVGFPVIRARDGSSAVIDIGYGESVNHDGCIDPKSDGVLQSDRVILHGGRQEWEAFGRRAFRYVQLTFSGLASPLHLESVAVRRIGYPVEEVSTFECSDESLNEAWRAGVYNLSVSMQDDYECSPLREEPQDAECAAIQALTNYYCFFDAALAAKILKRFAGIPESGLAWIRMLHDYYLYTGDRPLVEELFPSVKRAVEQSLQGKSREAFYYQILRGAAIDESVEWMARAEGIRDTFNAEVGSAGPHAGFHLLQALAGAGDEKMALDMIRAQAAGNSMPFAATYFLPAEILGVKPSMPESGVVVIQPRPGDLKWAKGRIKTHSCVVEVEWAFEPGHFRMDISAPEGFIAALPVRGLRNPRIDEIDQSPETPERRARKTYGWSNTIWSDGEEHDPYVDWLKTQETEPPAHYQHKKRLSTEEQYVWVRESAATQVRYEISEGPGL